MATRAAIIIENGDGTVTGIYNHNDGYVSYLGRMLREHYPTIEDARALVALGDVSQVGETLDDTIAYHRDRQEPWDSVKPLVCLLGDVAELIESQYIYHHNGTQWMVKEAGGDWVTL